MVNRDKLYIGYSVMYNANAGVNYDGHLKSQVQEMGLRTPRDSNTNSFMGDRMPTIVFPGAIDH
jgi:hypothetical protein